MERFTPSLRLFGGSPLGLSVLLGCCLVGIHFFLRKLPLRLGALPLLMAPIMKRLV